jgi:hypothetical protein
MVNRPVDLIRKVEEEEENKIQTKLIQNLPKYYVTSVFSVKFNGVTEEIT